MPAYKAPQRESEIWGSRDVLSLNNQAAATGESISGFNWRGAQTAQIPGQGAESDRRAGVLNVHTMWTDRVTKREHTNATLLADNAVPAGSTEPAHNEDGAASSETPRNEVGSSLDNSSESEKEQSQERSPDQNDQENTNVDEDQVPKKAPINLTPAEAPRSADKNIKKTAPICKSHSPKDPLPEYPLDYGRLEDPNYIQTLSDAQLKHIAEWWVMCLTANPNNRRAPTCKAQELARQEIARRQKKNGQSIDAILNQAKAYNRKLRDILSKDGADRVNDVAGLERLIQELECEREGNVSAIRNGPEYYKNRLHKVLLEVKAATKDYLERSYNQRKARIQSKIDDKLKDIDQLNQKLVDFSEWLARIDAGVEIGNNLESTLKTIDQALKVLGKVLKSPGPAMAVRFAKENIKYISRLTREINRQVKTIAAQRKAEVSDFMELETGVRSISEIEDRIVTLGNDINQLIEQAALLDVDQTLKSLDEVGL